MKSGFKFAAFAGIAVLTLGSLSPADTSTHSKKKATKVVLPPLPSGPQGPVPQIPLDSIAPVQPQVSYQNGQLTIVAPNSTLGDILRAVRKQTSADIEVPPATERVVTHLGPGPAREIVAELLNGSRFNYVLLGSPSDASALTRVVLVAKSGSETVVAANGQPQQPVQPQGNLAPPPADQQPDASDAPDAAAEENPDDNADQNAAAEPEQQPVVPPDASGIKTPQQMLQEMQQRQMQLQQNQPPGQPPIPGSGFPGRPMPPEQQPQQQ
jgi:hypothetical protein